LPCEPKLIVLYLLHLSKTGVSMAVINLAIAAITWKHTTQGYNSPCENNFVKEAIAGLKHRLAKPRSPKEPLSLNHLHNIIDSSNLKDLTELRNVVFFTLAFYAFLRFDEAVAIRVSHVTFNINHLEIIIPSAKNDQLREGNKVLVAKIDGDYCPYSLLKSYFETVDFDKKSEVLMFRRVIIKGDKKCLHPADLPLKYINVLDTSRRALEKIGLDSKKYGTHSLRAGGSTSAANSGLEDRLFQRHGRWKTVGSKNAYIKDNVDRLLSVTKNLK
jgi:integrase